MAKRKWTGRQFGHDQVVDYQVLNAKSIISYSHWQMTPLKLVLLVLCALFLAVLLVDTVSEFRRSSNLAKTQQFLRQTNISSYLGSVKNVNDILNSLGEASGVRYLPINDVSNYLEKLSFSGPNSFFLPQDRGIIYIKPTTLPGRAISPMAKRFHVAIILNNRFDFYTPSVFDAMNIVTKAYKKFNQLDLVYFELELTKNQWNWFSRQLLKELR